jgi:integrase
MAASLTHRFHDAQVRAGLAPVRFHDLRHAAATLMLASGVDLKVVSELLGHSTIATTANVYAGVLDSLKVDAADRLTRLMAR